MENITSVLLIWGEKMGQKSKGYLIIIGGAEDKSNDCTILKEFINLSNEVNDEIIIITTATKLPSQVGMDYKEIFEELGAKKINIVNIDNRKDANESGLKDKILRAGGVFFTGGDQLRITSLLGGTEVYKALHRAYLQGTLIAGTSAGASAMSQTMIIDGEDEAGPKKCTLKMAPGMGLLSDVVVDQHFAQRGRIGRLMVAVAENPYVLGVGIDENTAIIVEPNDIFRVIGEGTVTVIDGSNISYTNVSELKPDQSLALCDVKIHILPKDYHFDLKKRERVQPH